MRNGVHIHIVSVLWLWRSVIAAVDVLPPSVNSSSSPAPASPPSACDPLHETLQGWTGHVQWMEQEKLDCDLWRTWRVRVPAFHGLFFYVQHMLVQEGTVVGLQGWPSDDTNGSVYDLHVWRETDHTFRMGTIQGGLMLSVKVAQQKSFRYSSFNVTYTVYHESNLPRRISSKVWDDFEDIFNCSHTNPVPEALTCDGVRHCIGDEDEMGCEYRLTGCGDWLPYHGRCLKLGFVRRFYVLGVDFPALAVHCHDSEATLAILPDEEGVQLVADLLYKAGLSSALVDLHKAEPQSKKMEHLYRFIWQWGTKGGPMAYQQPELQRTGELFDCAVLSLFPFLHFEPVSCASSELSQIGYVCMRPNPTMPKADSRHVAGVHLPEATGTVQHFLTKQCEDGSVVHIFHQCQWQGQVLSTAWSPNHFSLFQCTCGPPVHYSLVCDGNPDCVDGSDESGCLSPHTLRTKAMHMDSLSICGNLQVVFSDHHVCDGVPHCSDHTDEDTCVRCAEAHCEGVGCVPFSYVSYFQNCGFGLFGGVIVEYPYDAVLVPAVSLDGHGMSSLTEVGQNTGYFPCNNGLHIPAFLLNNLEWDCPEGEDENIPPGNFTCPGFYRCQYYGNCIHPDFVCDGVPHCPNKDDESYCLLTHPSNCTCEGFACSCRQLPLPLWDLWYLRYLDVSGVRQPPVSELTALNWLQLLNASFCQLNNVTLLDMPQLRVLDLSYNALSALSSMVMENLAGLTHLNVSGNALVPHLDASFSAFFTQTGMTQIQHLGMANTHVSHIEGYSFSSLPQLVSLDLRSDSLEMYDTNIFGGLHALKVLHTEQARLCCPYFHTNVAECYAPVDELSSCSDLLRLDAFRVFLWSFSVLTTVGNCAVLIYRLVKRESKTSTSYHILVSHLCIADLLMGVYMLIIGAADAQFRGHYVAHEVQWKQSKACLAAGFLAFVSSEVSAFIICLITLDRLLMLCFPFKPHLHLSAASFMKLGGVAWALGVLLAAVPLMGQLEFYGESSVCLPLPITRHHFSGQVYAFLVFIALNFLLFLFIGTGQLAIYRSVCRTKATVKTKRQEEDSAIAHRLFLVVFSDFCCWFPVGLMGLLTLTGLSIPPVVTVWVAIFVLPVNSAINPFLYTLNTVREQWRMRKLNQKSKRILFDLKNEIPKLAPDVIEEVVLACVSSNKALRLEKVREALQVSLHQHNTGQDTTIGAGTDAGPSTKQEEIKPHVSGLDSNVHLNG